MNYDQLIKRAKKAIADASAKLSRASVHRATIDDSIEKLNGLVVVMHPDYQRPPNTPSHRVQDRPEATFKPD